MKNTYDHIYTQRYAERKQSMNKNSGIEKIIAQKVSEAGGRTFYVGGLVRDRLLGADNKDVDIEIHGITPETLMQILRQCGEPLSFGESFGIYSLRGEDIDIAMPRRERKSGEGHRDFEVDVDPFIGTYEAAKRRDFTINALMEDVLTGEIVDHFGGTDDLKAGIIRHIDDVTFIEDPLRVLRAAQFAARFDFRIAPETVEFCRSIDLSSLSRERVVEEMKKALLKAKKPSVFFESLREMGQLSVWFPELEELIGLEQDPIYHPEGDVWIHTMEVVDRAAEYRNMVADPFPFMMLALTHDLGKIVTTEVIKGRIHAYEHETKGLPVVERFVTRLTNENVVIKYVLNMVPLHMRPNMLAYSKAAKKSTNKMFDKAIAPEDLIYFARADHPVVSGDEAFTGDSDFLFERLDVFRKTMDEPYVMGRDLIEAGFEPGEDFSEFLSYGHKLRLAGIDKESALKQVIAEVRKKRNIRKDV